MISTFILAALCAADLLVIASVRRVPKGHVYTFRRLGVHVRIVGSGTHLIVPLVERVAHKISLAGATVAVDDLVLDARRMRGVVYFQVLDPQRAEVMIEDLEHQLRAALRRLVADAALPEGADARRQWVKQSLNAQLRERGLLVARVDLAPLA
mgnify:FL=1